MLTALCHWCVCRGVCLHAWKLFSRSLLADEDGDKTLGLYRHRSHICKPAHGLSHYTQPLLSPATDFVTHLVISGGCDFSVSEMLCLADMANLGVLELIQPADDLGTAFPEVTDRLVRGWCEKDDPFPRLRVLRIWGDQTTTQDSLRWVSTFPALALYDVMGSREDWAQPHQRGLDYDWELARPAGRAEDSLLRYLMLLAAGEEAHLRRVQEMARSIDSDLVSLCSDSRCAVRFVQHGHAPRLVEYLSDTAKAHAPPWDPDAIAARGLARSCREVTFEAWAFWLYALVGQLNDDEDMARAYNGSKPPSQAVVGPFVLPSKPLACLFLGHSGRGGIPPKPSYVSRGLFATKRYTFTRPSIIRAGRAVDRADAAGPELDRATPVPDHTLRSLQREQPGAGVRRQKRKRLDDMLSGLMR